MPALVSLITQDPQYPLNKPMKEDDHSLKVISKKRRLDEFESSDHNNEQKRLRSISDCMLKEILSNFSRTVILNDSLKLTTTKKKNEKKRLSGCFNNKDEKSKRRKLGDQERLGLLPDCILEDIISYLPIHEAARTAILSWRWRDLWTKVPRLHLDLDHFLGLRAPPCKFRQLSTTVDHILAKLEWPKLLNFKVTSTFPQHAHDMQHCSSCLESWIPRICARNPEEITVIIKAHEQLDCGIKPYISILSCLFGECPSLTRLCLVGKQLKTKLPEDGIINLPNLKKLHMEVTLPHCQCQRMLSIHKSCPLLEDMNVRLVSKETGAIFYQLPAR